MLSAMFIETVPLRTVAPSSYARQMDEQQAPPSTPPGWYPDPKMAGTQRYWDGNRWSDHVAPLAGPTPTQAQTEAFERMKANATLETVGWITAIFLPFVGVVVGIILAIRGSSRGPHVILLSLAIMGLAYLYLANQATTY